LIEHGKREDLLAAGAQFIRENRRSDAIACFARLAEEKSDLNARFIHAQLIDDGSHKQLAAARDAAVSILEDFPALFD
ncbi:hypothetical protein ABTK13_24165, partial [Acinetobacter baumannii]